jgi:hypothetical protein
VSKKGEAVNSSKTVSLECSEKVRQVFKTSRVVTPELTRGGR